MTSPEAHDRLGSFSAAENSNEKAEAGVTVAGSDILASRPRHASARPRRRARTFYLGLCVLMTLIVAVGFWPSYFGPLLRGMAARPWILHFHGAVYVGWMALLIVQATLAARGRIAAHRSLGTIGIGYGMLVWIVGLAVSFVAPAMRVAAGEWTVDDAAAFLPIPLGDMVLFGGFFAAAVAYRHRPAIHKRLILLATVALLFAAVSRMSALGASTPVQLAVWFAPVVLGMGYDLSTMRRVHPVYWIGFGVMVAALARMPFRQTETWLGVGRRIVEALA